MTTGATRLTVGNLVCLALLLSGTTARSAEPAEVPALRLCTGRPGNTYHRIGRALSARLAGTVRVEIIATHGSWENLERAEASSPGCDALIAQDDAWALYHFERPEGAAPLERVAVLYPETVHLICNRGVEVQGGQALDPKTHRVVIDEYGSGTFITWRLMGKLGRSPYGLTPVTEAETEAALKRVADGRHADCAMVVAAAGMSRLRWADAWLGDRLRLVPLVDRRLERPVGRERRAVYRPAEIPAGTYRELASGPVATIAVDAVFLLHPAWRDRHPAVAPALVAAVRALPRPSPVGGQREPDDTAHLREPAPGTPSVVP